MNRFGLALTVLGVLALTVSCGHKPRLARIPSGAAVHQEGLATWYGKGDGYHGKRTASGEIFDRNQLTAAHYNLPFGTRVRVINRTNGKKVIVRINDRFPAETQRKGRIIDVSYAAAKKLGMVLQGVVPVELEVLDVPGDG